MFYWYYNKRIKWLYYYLKKSLCVLSFNKRSQLLVNISLSDIWCYLLQKLIEYYIYSLNQIITWPLYYCCHLKYYKSHDVGRSCSPSINSIFCFFAIIQNTVPLTGLLSRPFQWFQQMITNDDMMFDNGIEKLKKLLQENKTRNKMK